MGEQSYSWGGVNYPHFYPRADELNPGAYIVEMAITCYPYMSGSRFEAGAFPAELRGLGRDGSTKFAFLARDDDGMALENLGWAEACEMSDALNDEFHYVLDDAAEQQDWNDCPIEFDTGDLLYSK